MKRSLFLFLFIWGSLISMNAQDLRPIKLNPPSKKRGASVMEAFSNRQSVRAYSDKKLADQDLSDLVWATLGINRPESGLRTAPSARNLQPIDLYVCFPEGVYFYNAKEHVLEPFAKGDFYPMIAVNNQEFVNDAPVILLLVADFSRFPADYDQKMVTSAMDAGIVSQNISIFCAGAGMATVPRGWMDKAALKKAMKLNDSQYIMLNHPVGYAK